MLRLRLTVGGLSGEFQHEAAALFGSGLHADRAAVLVHDLAADGKAQSCAAGAFVGSEKVEDGTIHPLSMCTSSPFRLSKTPYPQNLEPGSTPRTFILLIQMLA